MTDIIQILEDLQRASTFMGMKVIECPWLPKKPRFQLAENVPVTQEFRDGFNAWAREFFGEDEQAYVFGDILAISPKTAAIFRYGHD